MTEGLSMLAALAALFWLAIVVLPWQPWRNREVLEAEAGEGDADLSDITVVIPARNEAEVIATTLGALAAQGRRLKVVVVDDASSDDTAAVARQVQGLDLRVMQSQPLPPGWSGKLWALEQACGSVATPLTLLLDADIRLEPGMLPTLRRKMRSEGVHFVSLMATLRMDGVWEKLLMPAFVYFFKFLYPFALSNSRFKGVAAAAGGCIMLETRLLKDIGGFGVIREALIDDCSLARTVKGAGNRTWIGLSRSVVSLRSYDRLSEIWDMVARTAYTQLRYSVVLLLLCTAFMFVLFWLPPLGLLAGGATAKVSFLAYGLMALLYWPTLAFYGRSPWWAWAMPFIAALYMAMTWTSAIRYWRGVRSRWKGRVYE
ncbi:glycosyltransferase [Methylogaea oryzae]|uniref:Glycosyl transferase family 2 n=1 Tax=Methylogaea oryzae TaxID=1295382 RepID=A0A8D4VNG7_9GAMM|nr:glycosyltransferase [Methylogaea oryzae]BBL70732.1 glycosyl transferase family 2 [Methylogaea oryzae]